MRALIVGPLLGAVATLSMPHPTIAMEDPPTLPPAKNDLRWTETSVAKTLTSPAFHKFAPEQQVQILELLGRPPAGIALIGAEDRTRLTTAKLIVLSETYSAIGPRERYVLLALTALSPNDTMRLLFPRQNLDPAVSKTLPAWLFAKGASQSSPTDYIAKLLRNEPLISGFQGAVIAKALLRDLTAPGLITQGPNPLCNVMATQFLLARNDPTRYVRYICELATERACALSDGSRLEIQPSWDLGEGNRRGRTVTDILIQSALADYVNGDLPYDPADPEPQGSEVIWNAHAKLPRVFDAHIAVHPKAAIPEIPYGSHLMIKFGKGAHAVVLHSQDSDSVLLFDPGVNGIDLSESNEVPYNNQVIGRAEVRADGVYVRMSHSDLAKLLVTYTTITPISGAGEEPTFHDYAADASGRRTLYKILGVGAAGLALAAAVGTWWWRRRGPLGPANSAA